MLQTFFTLFKIVFFLLDLNCITRPNCVLDRRTILCLYVPGFQRQVFERVIFLSQRSKKRKEKKEEQKVRPCNGIRLHFTNCAVWPRKVQNLIFISFFRFKKY